MSAEVRIAMPHCDAVYELCR